MWKRTAHTGLGTPVAKFNFFPRSGLSAFYGVICSAIAQVIFLTLHTVQRAAVRYSFVQQWK